MTSSKWFQSPRRCPTGRLFAGFSFLVSAMLTNDVLERVSRLIDRLAAGTRLRLLPEPANPTNPRALQLAAGRTVIGWVPDYLVDEIHAYLGRNRSLSFVVERANGPEAPWHLRVLCRLTVAPPPSQE